MIRQYHASGRRRGGPNPLGLGVVDAGDILYLQDECWLSDRYRGQPARRAPWIVEGFLNGALGAAVRNPKSGKWESRVLAGRSDMAIVRCLRSGRRREIAVRVLVMHRDLDLEHVDRDPASRRREKRAPKPPPAWFVEMRRHWPRRYRRRRTIPVGAQQAA